MQQRRSFCIKKQLKLSSSLGFEMHLGAKKSKYGIMSLQHHVSFAKPPPWISNAHGCSICTDGFINWTGKINLPQFMPHL